MKKKLTLSVDSKIIAAAKRQKINVSQFLEVSLGLELQRRRRKYMVTLLQKRRKKKRR